MLRQLQSRVSLQELMEPSFIYEKEKRQHVENDFLTDDDPLIINYKT